MQNHRCKILGLLALALTLLLGVSGPVNAATVITQNDCCPVMINDPGIWILGARLMVSAGTSGIVIGADNVSLFCDGETIRGDAIGNFEPGDGIVLTNRMLVTVDDCRVQNFRQGIVLTGSSFNVFRANQVGGNREDGFDLNNSNSNVFIGNRAGANGRVLIPGTEPHGNSGFDLNNSNSNVFTGNVATQNGNVETGTGDGFSLNGSEMNVLVDNRASMNRGNGFRLENMSNLNTIMGNTACNNGRLDFEEIDSIDNKTSNSNGFCRQ